MNKKLEKETEKIKKEDNFDRIMSTIFLIAICSFLIYDYMAGLDVKEKEAYCANVINNKYFIDDGYQNFRKPNTINITIDTTNHPYCNDIRIIESQTYEVPIINIYNCGTNETIFEVPDNNYNDIMLYYG